MNAFDKAQPKWAHSEAYGAINRKQKNSRSGHPFPDNIFIESSLHQSSLRFSLTIGPLWIGKWSSDGNCVQAMVESQA